MAQSFIDNILINYTIVAIRDYRDQQTEVAIISRNNVSPVVFNAYLISTCIADYVWGEKTRSTEYDKLVSGYVTYILVSDNVSGLNLR